MQLPRVLIFGQPFNSKYGGGITLSNLFRGWDKDKIAVAAIGHIMYGATADVCNNYFQLGENEYRWAFPFNLLQRKFPSGRMNLKLKSKHSKSRKKRGIRYALVNQVFYPVLEWLGLFHCLTKILLTPGFKAWIKEFNPDILYLQVSTRDSVLFASQLIDYLKIPSAIHIMDDWPSTISNSGLFKKFWSEKIDREFRELLKRIDLPLSISDAMSVEYYKRYERSFKPFHNPINISRYKKPEATNTKIENRFRVLYLGRLGIANKATIIHFAAIISGLEIDQLTVEFDIYTSDIDTPAAIKLSRMPSVTVKPAVKHEDVPTLLSSYDTLLLPLDFSKTGLTYARFSIPTKASEYMASGVPILVYASGETAISQFCSYNNCGHCVTDLNPNNMKEAIRLLINNEDYRKEITSNAYAIAREKFDEDIVKREFQRSLTQLQNSFAR